MWRIGLFDIKKLLNLDVKNRNFNPNTYTLLSLLKLSAERSFIYKFFFKNEKKFQIFRQVIVSILLKDFEM